ncbi:MAG: BrnT family toxin [Anaerolineae bacterium]|nr:BrnT family toxin [Anaerolineae bacterium]
MRIDDLLWLDHIVDKLEIKHQVVPSEVYEVFWNRPRFRYCVPGENVYRVMGCTDSRRYLVVFFVYKPADHLALIISAREMTDKERKSYGR